MISETSNNIIIERKISGKPNAGKILVAVGANITDIPIYSSGTCAKLMDEGYKGYFIRISNDELYGDGSIFQNIHSNETETMNSTKALGFSEIFNLYYQNHTMHGKPLTDLIVRLVFIFRMLKADTVISLMPSDFDEIIPEKEVTFNAVKQAVILSGNKNYYAEHLDADLTAQFVSKLYIAVNSNYPSCNRIVDISSSIEQKIDSILECKTQGVGRKGSLVRKELASEGKQLSVLGKSDDTANREYIRHFILDADKQKGLKYGMEYAETFCYIDREKSGEAQKLKEYIENNAVKI
ncbi:hypothetical protein ACFL50_04775 [Candidatus Latescibacterota bacterium]